MPSGNGSPRQTLLRVIALAAFFGLVTGFLESGLLTVIRLVPGWITWNLRESNVSLDFLWIAPLLDLAYFLCIGTALGLGMIVLGRVPLLRRVASLDVAVFALAAASTYVVLRVPDRLYQTSALLIAAGVAVQTARWFGDAPQERLRRVIASLPWLGAAVVLLWAGIDGGARVAEMRRARALPPIDGRTPNVLLVVLDTVRADHLSLHGYPRGTTPHLEQIGREGVVFDRAISPSSWTLATHASLFTGRYVHEHRTDSEQPVLGNEWPTLAEAMSERGFAAAGFSANTFWATRSTGMARGFEHFEDYFEEPGDAVSRTVIGKQFITAITKAAGRRDTLGRRRADEITDAFTSWLDRHGNRPYFAFLNYLDAHAPYTAPEPFHTRFMTPSQRAGERGFAFRPPLLVTVAGEEDFYSRAYDGGISYLDSEVDRLLQALRARGSLDRTLVVMVADHGESLGDHGFYDHGHSLYMDQIHVPLIVRWPGVVPAGVRVPEPVSTVDVAATILDLSGPGLERRLPGLSLSSHWAAEQSGKFTSPVVSEVGHRGGTPAPWPISRGRVRSLVEYPWHLIEYEDGRVELFDMRDDSTEVTDLAGGHENHDIVSKLRAELDNDVRGASPEILKREVGADVSR